jgi:hydroxyacylglutathione hydrolase
VTTIDLVDPSSVTGTLLDVRQRSEFQVGHVPGAQNIELGALSTTSTPQGAITVMCGHGERAMTGASLLEQHGHHELAVLTGGPEDWSAHTGKPLELES